MPTEAKAQLYPAGVCCRLGRDETVGHVHDHGCGRRRGVGRFWRSSRRHCLGSVGLLCPPTCSLFLFPLSLFFLFSFFSYSCSSSPYHGYKHFILCVSSECRRLFSHSYDDREALAAAAAIAASAPRPDASSASTTPSFLTATATITTAMNDPMVNSRISSKIAHLARRSMLMGRTTT